MTALELAQANLLSPMVLFFVLGLLAAIARSDLAFPEAAAKAMALYLMMAIGFKGGASVAEHGVSAKLAVAVAAGVALSLLMPVIAFALLQRTTRLDSLSKLLDSYSFKGTLARGFALVRDASGAPVLSAAAATPGAAVSIEFGDGKVAATIDGEPRSPAPRATKPATKRGGTQGDLF